MEQPARSTVDYATPASEATALAGRGAVMAWAVVGLVLGLGCMWPVIGLGGFGHGWSSAFSVSWLALFTSPLAGVAS